ncbi:hypothetical protein [Parahaliea aestuarii]|uniref:Uncharacterized protein n=1 Tax=Parahaliea aestuarii TaxID=1852021 RepID=A0A5C8ZVX0_9GAMM|nr:hypothetical protein [Parahaliea aestuarii]TXS91700.1 hypothetical protein FVW59_11125 [Parahaliea aestuarii]
MDTRKFSLLLIAGGLGLVLIAAVWFFITYAEAMEMAGSFMGEDYSARLLACLYSSTAICEGAVAFAEGPAYSPVVFWLGVIALLAGSAAWFASGQHTAVSGESCAAQRHSEPAGFIPPARYTRYCYLLALAGAGLGLLVSPLAVLSLVSVLLAVLGLTGYRARLNILDVSHLSLVLLVSTAAALLLLLTRGTLLFLLVALAQVACLYVGFNSFRGQRSITIHNVKEECRAAFRQVFSSVRGEQS